MHKVTAVGRIGSYGHAIRRLLGNGEKEVTIVAPFIQLEAFTGLISGLTNDVHIRCVSRWLPRDVASGVSDPRIHQILEDRGNFRLSLVDRLHAKIYISGDRCLIGSANVTHSGLGAGRNGGNIEVLAEVPTDSLSVVEALEAIAHDERQATKEMAEAVLRHAESLHNSVKYVGGRTMGWFPRSRKASEAYEVYRRPPSGYVKSVDRILLADVARCNLAPGMSEQEFGENVRSLLKSIPIANDLFRETHDEVFARRYADRWLDNVADGEFSKDDIWRAFVDWVAVYFPRQFMRHEMSTVALRRAGVLE